MEQVLKVEGLCKKYAKNANYAVENVTFSCDCGEIVGLLGHNGAGKSTTLKCLEGMLPYDEGIIEICGEDVKKSSIKAKSHMGFVTDNHAVFLRLTGLEYLSFMADVYGVKTAERKIRIAELDEVFQLGEALKRLALKENVTDILYDMKCIDPGRHLELTAVDNGLILANLAMLAADSAIRPKLHMRMPLVGGLNDDMELMKRTAAFYREHRVPRVTLLPYHSLGVSKMRHIGGRQETYAAPAAEYTEEIRALFEEAGLRAEISGVGRK